MSYGSDCADHQPRHLFKNSQSKNQPAAPYQNLNFVPSRLSKKSLFVDEKIEAW